MRLSNKSTFSLVCFILLMAFVALPVMAHAPLDDGTKPGNLNHGHPLLADKAAVDLNDDDDDEDEGEALVEAHNHHPIVEDITLKESDNVRGRMVAVDDTTNTTFILVVDFDRDVVSAPTAIAVPAFDVAAPATGAALVEGDFTFTLLNVDNSNATVATITAINRVADDDSIYELVVTPGAYPSGMADENDKTLRFRIQLDAADGTDGVYSLQIRDIPPGEVSAEDIPGGGNLESDIYTFTLVSELETLTAPTVSVAAPTAPDTTSGNLAFTITADPAVTGLDDTAGATNTDITVTGGVLVSVTGSGTTYTATVDPTDMYTDVTVTVVADAVMHGEESTVTGPATAASDMYDAPEQDLAPTVTITHTLDDTSGDVTFKFVFSEPVSFGSGDIIVENGTPGPFKILAALNSYELVVTPKSGVRVTVKIADDTVLDSSNQAVAETSESYTPEGYTPAIKITAVDGSGDADGKIVFTLNFSDVPKSFRIGQQDIDVSNSKVTTLADLVELDEPTEGYAASYALTVTPADTTMAVTLTIQAGAIMTEDAEPLAFDSATYSHTLTQPPSAPTVSVAAPTAPTSGNLAFTITTVPAVTGLDTTAGTANVDITVTGGELVSVTGSGTTYTATVDPTDMYTDVTVTVAANAVMHGEDSTVTGPATAASGMYDAPDRQDSANPTSPSNIMMVEIPAESYVVLVRSMSTTEGALRFPDVPPVNGAAVDVKVWSDMPDLWNLFQRTAQNRGGAIVLRKSADAHDNDMADADGNLIGTYATPAVGSVGISEIMWARDLGKGTAAQQAAGQWIELQNLNSKPVKVLIYAQKGSEGLVSGGLLVNTAAGDSLLGNPGGMVVDAIQNIRNDGNQANGGWDIKGNDGNSVAGVSFASMHRILPDKQPAYTLAQNYTKRKGTNGGHWNASGGAYLRSQTTHTSGGVTNVPILFDYRGTPGDVNNRTGIEFHVKAGKTNLNDGAELIFNEIANRSDADKAYEWIEILNRTNSVKSLRSYIITMLRQKGTDANAQDEEVVLYHFAHNTAADVPANGVLLLVASDPAADNDHPLSIGYNIDKPEEDQVSGFKGAHVPRYKVVNFGSNGLPNGNFVLVLRRPDTVEGHNDGGRGRAETGRADFDQIVDMAGYANLKATNYPNPVSNTNLWPLDDFPAPGYTNNNLVENTVHHRAVVRDNKDGDRFGTGAWDNDNNKSAFRDAGYTGLGYRRDVPRDGRYGGTPGYHGSEKGLAADFADDVVISELMLSTGSSTNRRLPQWIEITNNSGTKTVNLSADSGWRLVIETPVDAIRTINFKAKGQVKYIYPKQTILIVAGSPTRNAQAGSDRLPNNIVFKTDRVFNVLREYGAGFTEIQDAPDDLRADLTKSDRYRFLNQKHFNIKLIDGKGNVADEVGNLDGNPRTNDKADWDYPNGLTKGGDRTSFIRVFDDGMKARTAVGSDAVDVLPLDAGRSGAVEAGTLDLNDYDSVIPAEYAWIQAASINFDSIYVRHTWYGSEDDYGTPGVLKGQVLPVSLSFFRPTLEDGKVVIRWTTESELDNAGFNILRSESRNGEFTKVNDQLIQGKGSTAERSNYKWVDTSAKPGAVYYYQIEDVSFAGEHNTLTTTKMKGLISAKDKLTTKWGELKEVQ